MNELSSLLVLPLLQFLLPMAQALLVQPTGFAARLQPVVAGEEALLRQFSGCFK